MSGTGNTSTLMHCPRCGQIVELWHTLAQCDAYYDAAYAAASRKMRGRGLRTGNWRRRSS